MEPLTAGWPVAALMMSRPGDLAHSRTLRRRRRAHGRDEGPAHRGQPRGRWAGGHWYADMASCKTSEDVLGLLLGPSPKMDWEPQAAEGISGPSKRSNNENGHGHAIESLDLQAPSTQDARKNLPPSSSRSGGAGYATARGGLPDGAGTAIKRERARGSPRAQGLGRLARMAGWAPLV